MPISLNIALSILFGILCVPQTAAQTGPESFDGSFRLQTGEVITGGYFVENARGRFLYLDPERLAKGGLFERVSDTLLRSLVPPGAVEIEFARDTDGSINSLEWREQGGEPVRGTRVHPHRSGVVQFTSADGTELHGRLLVPACGGPHPMVVSVHGSGPVDRHGGPYQMFFLKHGLAGAALSNLETALHEVRQEMREEGLSGLDLDYAMALRREIYLLARSGKPLSATDALVAPYVDESGYRVTFGTGPISRRWSAGSWEWMRRNLGVVPAPDVARFTGPVLWFLGGIDENVPLVPTRASLERAFAASSGDYHEMVVIDGAVHSFLVPCRDGMPRFASGFFDRMAAWLKARGFSEPACGADAANRFD